MARQTDGISITVRNIQRCRERTQARTRRQVRERQQARTRRRIRALHTAGRQDPARERQQVMMRRRIRERHTAGEQGPDRGHPMDRIRLRDSLILTARAAGSRTARASRETRTAKASQARTSRDIRGSQAGEASPGIRIPALIRIPINITRIRARATIRAMDQIRDRFQTRVRHLTAMVRRMKDEDVQRRILL